MKKLLLLLFLPLVLLPQTTSPIQDVIFNPTDTISSGSTVQGSISIVSNVMDVSGHIVTKTLSPITIKNGVLNFNLAVNDTSNNQNSYYIANFTIKSGTNNTNYSEKWSVYTSVSPLTLHQIRVNTAIPSPIAPVLASQLVAGANGTCPVSQNNVVAWGDCGGSFTTSPPAYLKVKGLPAGSWTYNNNQKGEHAIIHSGKLYVPLENGVSPYTASGIGVIDPATGILEKFISVPTPCMESAPTFDNSGYLYAYSCSSAIGTQGSFIVKIDLTAGTVLNTISYPNIANPDWEKLTYDPVHDYLIVLASTGVRAIRTSNFSTVWTNTDVNMSCGGCSPIQTAPILVNGGFAYWRDNQGAIWKINTTTGVTAASQSGLTTSFSGVYAQLSLDSVNGHLYGTTMTNIAFALNTSDMSILWSRTLEDSGWNFDRGGAYANGVYYVTPRLKTGSAASKVYALNGTTGAIIWTNTSTYDVSAEISSMLVDNTYVYVSTTNYIGGSYDKILMIKVSDGTLQTVVPLIHVIASSIPVAWGGKIIIGLWDQFGYEALQFTSGGTTNDWTYKGDENQTGYIGTQLSGTFNTITDTNTTPAGGATIYYPASNQLPHYFVGTCGTLTVQIPCQIQPSDLGVNPSGTKALYGDGTWKVPTGSGATPCTNVVSFSSTPNFDFSICTQQVITLTGNVVPSISNAGSCQITGGCTIAFIQGSGSYTVTWPGSVLGGFRIGTTNTKYNVQAFTSIDGSNIYAITPGIINQ